MTARLTASLAALVLLAAACASAPTASPAITGAPASAATPSGVPSRSGSVTEPSTSPRGASTAMPSASGAGSPSAEPSGTPGSALVPTPIASATVAPTATPHVQDAIARLLATGAWSLTADGPLERGDGCVEFPAQPGRPLFIAVNGSASFPATGDWSLSVTDPDGSGPQPLGIELQRERGTYLYTWESGIGEGEAAFDAASRRLTLDVRLRDLLGEDAVDLEGVVQCGG